MIFAADPIGLLPNEYRGTAEEHPESSSLRSLW